MYMILVDKGDVISSKLINEFISYSEEMFRKKYFFFEHVRKTWWPINHIRLCTGTLFIWSQMFFKRFLSIENNKPRKFEDVFVPDFFQGWY